MPPFDFGGGLLPALVRAAWDAALLSLFGALVFRAVVEPRASARAGGGDAVQAARVLRRCVWWSLGAAVPALLAWTWLEAGAIAGTSSFANLLLVARDTLFGHLVLLQLLGLALTAVLLLRHTPSRLWAATIVTGVTTVLQAGHGHALAMEDGPSLLLGASVLHLLSAGAWLGGLLPLLLVVRVASPRTGAMAARWFSPLGKWCVGGIAASAAVQFYVLIGGFPALVGTAYGWMAAAKGLLFVALLGFAWVNRYWFAPRLMRQDGAASRPVLIRSIAVQTGCGVLVVVAASLLANLPPSIHEQPIWPFPKHPSLIALADPDLRAEVTRGFVELTAGAALVLVGLMFWRRRWLALAGIGAGLLVGSASASHLDLLLVEAYPTSYYQSPTGFAATSITEGAMLFPAHCASCHGLDGRGDGPAAAGLPVPPADLTAEHLWAHDDGELFWWLSHGIEAPEGGVAMPGFAAELTADQRWALIDYIRAHNAGVSLRETDRWATPVQAPGFDMACPGRGAVTTDELRGSVLHVVALPPGSVAAPPAPGGSPVPVVTVLLTDGRALADPAACVSTDPATWSAFAILAGMPPAQMAGAQFLVDANGWMRAVQRPGEAAMRWSDPAALLAEVEAICGHPLSAPAGGHHHH